MPKVRLLDDLVSGDRLFRKGDEVRLTTEAAEYMTRTGRAVWTIKVRSLEEHLSVGNRVTTVGEIVETDEANAVRLHNTGRAEVIDPSELEDRNRLEPAPKHYRAPVMPELPHGCFNEEVARARGPKVKVRFLKEFTCGRRTYAAGDTAEVADFDAVCGVNQAALEIIGGIEVLSPARRQEIKPVFEDSYMGRILKAAYQPRG